MRGRAGGSGAGKRVRPHPRARTTSGKSAGACCARAARRRWSPSPAAPSMPSPGSTTAAGASSSDSSRTRSVRSPPLSKGPSKRTGRHPVRKPRLPSRGRPSRRAVSCSAFSTPRRTACPSFSRCARRCSTCFRSCPSFAPSTRISSTSCAPGSTVGSSRSGASTGAPPLSCSRRSSSTRRCTRSSTGRTCSAAWRRTGVASGSFIPPFPTSPSSSWRWRSAGGSRAPCRSSSSERWSRTSRRWRIPRCSTPSATASAASSGSRSATSSSSRSCTSSRSNCRDCTDSPPCRPSPGSGSGSPARPKRIGWTARADLATSRAPTGRPTTSSPACSGSARAISSTRSGVATPSIRSPVFTCATGRGSNGSTGWPILRSPVWPSRAA